MQLTEEIKNLFIETSEKLFGSARRTFMASVVKLLGKGGQRKAEEKLGWNRGTVRKGQGELENGERKDEFSLRGRKGTEERLPHLLEDIRAIVDAQSQTDPSFKTTRLYTRLTVAEVRRQLIAQKGYSEVELPSVETLRLKINKLGYRLRSVQKSRPQKKLPETDAIFDQLDQLHAQTKGNETVVRMSMDAKATVAVGMFSRGGKSRVVVNAADHDFGVEEKLTPFGIFLPDYDEVYLYFTVSAVTSDFIVDCLRQTWLTIGHRFPRAQTLLLNQDNGSESNSHRTQFIKRVVELADEFQLTIQLAYYPPYHSKYNPIERVWGLLEQHWNGSLLDTVETILNFAQSMTWKKQQPVVKWIKQTYHRGIKLTQKEMALLEERLERLPHLEKWFVKILSALPLG